MAPERLALHTIAVLSVLELAILAPGVPVPFETLAEHPKITGASSFRAAAAARRTRSPAVAATPAASCTSRTMYSPRLVHPVRSEAARTGRAASHHPAAHSSAAPPRRSRPSPAAAPCSQAPKTLGGTRPDSLVKTRHRSRPWRRRGRSPTATLCLAGGEARAQVILTAAPHQHPRRCAAPARRLRGSPGASCSATRAPRRRSWTARRSSTALSPVWEEGEERVARLRRPIWGSPGGRGGLTRRVGAVAN